MGRPDSAPTQSVFFELNSRARFAIAAFSCGIYRISAAPNLWLLTLN
jgi:hypothetical protein